jgi:hypothetical protein
MDHPGEHQGVNPRGVVFFSDYLKHMEKSTALELTTFDAYTA